MNTTFIRMSTKSSIVARRAWKIVRLALMWARKGGLFKHRPALSISEVVKVIRKLVHSHESRGALLYGDHEFSFNETPVLRLKRHRGGVRMPHIPCIKPHVDFDYDYGSDEEEDGYDEVCCSGDQVQGIAGYLRDVEGEDEEEDEEIDVKAEEFIAKFYEQMKMQRQVSYLEYNEKMK